MLVTAASMDECVAAVVGGGEAEVGGWQWRGKLHSKLS